MSKSKRSVVTPDEQRVLDGFRVYRINAYEYLLTLVRNQAAVALNPGAWLPWNFLTTPPANRVPERQLSA